MSIMYSKYKDKQIDTDFEKEFEIENVVVDFSETDTFRDKLYNMCSFSVEYDDYQKWISIEDAPRAEHFYVDLVRYLEDILERNLTKDEVKELLEQWDADFNNIFADCEEWLYDRYRDSYDDYPED